MTQRLGAGVTVATIVVVDVVVRTTRDVATSVEVVVVVVVVEHTKVAGWVVVAVIVGE